MRNIRNYPKLPAEQNILVMMEFFLGKTNNVSLIPSCIIFISRVVSVIVVTKSRDMILPN